ncbi:site-specific integrase [Helicobacter jaachi]|uniref:Site-specific integrase n=1 Tax=Helicobacter jaachi TaxID=1677920 RepID=A0A4U8T9K1_9HELI|nr:tyrosine-type recombinase/integrase [Helicobacter jaachi]TLD95387.1 site-specific integrase [Helicobacter jaachi]
MHKQSLLTPQEVIALLIEFIIYKAKTYSHNTESREMRVKAYLELKYLCYKSFSKFDDIKKQIRLLGKYGIVSILKLIPLIDTLEYFIARHNGVLNTLFEEQEVIDYFFSLTKYYQASTIKSRISHFGSFCKFLDKKGIAVNQFERLGTRYHKEKKLPDFLNERQFNTFLETIHNFKPKTLGQKRLKIIILLASYTGIRTREVHHIKLNDIQEDSDKYIIKIQGKGSKQRYVSAKKIHIQEALNDFLQTKKLQGIKSIFLTQLKSSRFPTYCAINLKPFLEQCNLYGQRRHHLHILRHSFGSYVYEKSKDILLTQQALGHASLTSTEIYMHLNQEAHSRIANLFA